MKRIVIAALLITSVLVPAVATGLAGPARADVVAVSLPTTVTVSQPTVRFSATVRLDSTTSGLRSASLWFRYPNAVAATRVGTAGTHRPGFLVVDAVLDATRITPGHNQIQVKDNAGGPSRTITVDLRRPSRVKITKAEVRGDGRVALAVKVSHYDPKLDRFVPSRLSPVRLQVQSGRTWVSVGVITTDSAGRAATVITAGPGERAYRALRPDGATVLAARSRIVRTVSEFQRD